MWNKGTLPKNFRKVEELKASGSGQFSEKSLDVLVSKIDCKKLIIIDLREETHGFINGNAISLYKSQNNVNQGLSLDEMTAKEKKYFKNLSSVSLAVIYVKKKFAFPSIINDAVTEEQLCSSKNLKYYRFPTTDHKRPLDFNIDRFISLAKNTSPDDWLHFHCEAGIGRTTTFLVMLDCMKNADKISFDDIIQRQQKLLGVDLLKAPQDYRSRYALERMLFLKKYYQYCKNNPLFEISWSTWILSDTQASK